jgi:hypothetical protein
VDEGPKCDRSLRQEGVPIQSKQWLTSESDFPLSWTNNIFSLAIDQNLEQSGDGDGQPFDGESS